MKINVYSKDITVSPDVSERINSRLAFLDKYFMIDESTIAQVNIKKHGSDVKLEITIPSKIGYLRSEVVDRQLENAIDDSVEKLEKQITRQKGRLNRRHKEKLSKTFVQEAEAEQPEEKVKKVKRIAVDELDSEEAIMQMELLGHNFFIYKDRDSKVDCVVYKREDGGYGVIEIV